MRPISELDGLLRSQLEGARWESSGHFTLSVEKAIELLAGAQLPRPSQWILKVVQGAVASRATGLDIRLTRVDSQVRWQGDPLGSPEEVVQALLRADVEGLRGLDALKRGLWTVSLAGQRPFKLSLPGASQSLLWTGDGIELLPCSPADQFQLIVSHFGLEERGADRQRRDSEAAEENATLLKELADAAFVCPIPLQVDGRRLDALQGAPYHGQSPLDNAFFLGLAAVESPSWSLPPATFLEADKAPSGTIGKAMPLSIAYPCETTALATMLTVHLKTESRGRGTSIAVRKELCRIFWILDGVVVHREQLDRDPGCVSCALFASAQGLELDLSGFQLRDTPAYRQRRDLIVRAAPQTWGEARIDLEPAIQNSSRVGRIIGAMVVGGSLLTLNPLTAGVGMLAGAMLWQSGELERGIQQTFRESLEELKHQWP